MICLLESNSRSFLEIGEAYTDVISTSMSIPADFILGTGHKKKMLNYDMTVVVLMIRVLKVLRVIQMSFNIYTTHEVTKTFLFTEKALYTRDVQRNHKIP